MFAGIVQALVPVETCKHKLGLKTFGLSWLKYVFDKGFLAVNGCSLTIARVDAKHNTFSINLIPEMLKRTNFSRLKVGDKVNIEVESQTQAIVDTVERVMAERYGV